MAWQLKGLAALPEDVGSIHSTHMAVLRVTGVHMAGVHLPCGKYSPQRAHGSGHVYLSGGISGWSESGSRINICASNHFS